MIGFRLAFMAAVLLSPVPLTAGAGDPTTVKAVAIDSGRHGEEDLRRITKRLLEQPGVSEVAFVQEPAAFMENLGHVAAGSIRETGKYTFSIILRTSPEVFTFKGLGLLEGRVLTADDRAGGPRVAVVNPALAAALAGKASAIGRHLSLRGRVIEIVGVVETPDETPRLFLPMDPGAEEKALVVLVQLAPSAQGTISRLLSLVCDVGNDWVCSSEYFDWGRKPNGVYGGAVVRSKQN